MRGVLAISPKTIDRTEEIAYTPIIEFARGLREGQPTADAHFVGID